MGHADMHERIGQVFQGETSHGVQQGPDYRTDKEGRPSDCRTID